MTIRSFIVVSTVAFALTACGGGGSGSGMGGTPNVVPATPDVTAPMQAPMGAARASLTVDADVAPEPPDSDDHQAILNKLVNQITIGSTVDPTNGDLNPYGLDVAKADAGSIHAGDLVICNFNDSANVQGNGTTIVALSPQQGSQPRHIAQDASLKGCDALALSPNDVIWNAAFSANDNPLFTPTGTLVNTLANGPWHGPFGETFSPTSGPFGSAAFYVTNAGDGSIVRVNINSGQPFTFDVIATGFAVNHGVPGSILGPSGLQYDAKHDRLYIVDGADNTLWSFKHVSTIPANGITIKGASVSGPFARRVRRIFKGAPLNGPISSALLANGHLVLGNTGNPDGKNIMVEIAPASGTEVARKNVDKGPAGALFGMVATGQNDDDTVLYFNDDNDNTLRALTR